MVAHSGLRTQNMVSVTSYNIFQSSYRPAVAYRYSTHPSKPCGRILRRNIPLAIQANSNGKNQDLGAEADTTTKKFGLEAGLWKVFTDKGADGRTKGEQAKELLKRYGSAYLITSVSFAIVSFAACYALVNSGVDVAALLGRIGIQVTDTSERVGTFALAYAAHKALSPVRFPPTVALTPVVARWLGKDISNSRSSDASGDMNNED